MDLFDHAIFFPVIFNYFFLLWLCLSNLQDFFMIYPVGKLTHNNEDSNSLFTITYKDQLF
jgi:hypothetical protein